jgi:integrase
VSAGVPEWHPHRLRHGIATLCEELFGDTGPEAARLLMGHADIKTTRRYVMATAEAMSSILDQIAPRIK